MDYRAFLSILNFKETLQMVHSKKGEKHIRCARHKRAFRKQYSIGPSHSTRVSPHMRKIRIMRNFGGRICGAYMWPKKVRICGEYAIFFAPRNPHLMLRSHLRIFRIMRPKTASMQKMAVYAKISIRKNNNT